MCIRCSRHHAKPRALYRPSDYSSETDLEDLIGSWKSFSARRIDKTLGLSGPLWQDESYDRIIRDEEHLWRSLQYIGRNPKKDILQTNEYLLWINPEWQQVGWNFDST